MIRLWKQFEKFVFPSSLQSVVWHPFDFLVKEKDGDDNFVYNKFIFKYYFGV